MVWPSSRYSIVAMFLFLQLVVVAGLLLLSQNIVYALPRPTGFCWKRIDTLFVFGDSYSYVEGRLGTKNYSWDNFTSPGSVHHNPILLNKTSAGGPNWAEYLTECYQGLPQRCDPALYDIAFAGADIDPVLISKHHPYTISFVEQVDQWKDHVDRAIHWKPPNTLATFWMGINDVGDTESWTNISFPTFYNQLIDVYFNKVDELYARNVRSFLFFNVPPRDRSPGGDSHDGYAQVIDTFNGVLDEHISAFQRKHTDANVMLINAFDLFNGYLDNAEELGFKDITTFCPNSTAPDFNTNYENYGCLAPYEYFWLNSGHPTYPVHRLLASDIERQLEQSSRC
ncbi:hypothetical protein BDB00DRAFT_427403 [Zychaea mexicana]|uniref:uncharacterized protein n=1 Tax=Zychaea mexicana TaxID=64656 RepID=UPI0022FE9319|nr:uncharacterized protein BDB00DRAFT_427403 [Zychaea mexicana]KAI9492662.1 hypothetical protein BDB00DRAFT_427403 [Zychaea mexicana]